MVDREARQIRRRIEVHANVGKSILGLGEVQDLPNDRGQIQQFESVVLTARERKELLDDRAEALHLLFQQFDLPQRPRFLGIGRVLPILAQEAKIERDRRERILDLVRQASGQRAEVREAGPAESGRRCECPRSARFEESRSRIGTHPRLGGCVGGCAVMRRPDRITAPLRGRRTNARLCAMLVIPAIGAGVRR